MRSALCSLKLSAASLWTLTACHNLPFLLHLGRDIYRRMLYFVPTIFFFYIKMLHSVLANFAYFLEISSLSFTTCRGPGNVLMFGPPW